MTKRFLERMPLAGAVETLSASVDRLNAETIKSEDALDRVCAEPLFATHPSPHYRASAMDGFAVRARETFAANDGHVLLSVLDKPARPGTDVGPAVPGSCLPVDTGDPIPDWADAVVRIENTKAVASSDGACSAVAVTEPVAPGKDIRRTGEDIEAAARIIARGARLRPQDIGALLATGTVEIPVVRRPRVTTIATGGEIVEPGPKAQPGRVIEFNARVLAGMAKSWGALCSYSGRTGDDRAALTASIRQAAVDSDIVCVIAGSSAGSKDFTIEVLEECGRLIVHGVDIMPGRPVAVALIDATPVLAIPGYPVSAYVVYREILAPLVAHMLGTAAQTPEHLSAQVRRKIPSRLGVEEFLRVMIRWDGDRAVATPLPRGAGSIGSVAAADGFLRIGRNCEGIESGSSVDIELLRPLAETYASLVAAGPACAITAAMEETLGSHNPLARIANLGVGREDAVATLARGEAEFALLRAGDDAEAARLEMAARETLGANTIVESAAMDDGWVLLIGAGESGAAPVGPSAASRASLVALFRSATRSRR